MKLYQYGFSILILLLIFAGSVLIENPTTIFLIGDSTMADKPFHDGNPEKGWGQVFPLYFKQGIQIDNHAVNGRSTKSFRNENRWEKVLSLIKPGDYVIIEFGHNDQKIQDSTRYADPEVSYRNNLIAYISDTRAKGAIPLLATPIARRKFDNRGNFQESHGRYPEVVREVAQSQQVILLDLHRLTRELVNEYGEENSKKLFLHINPGEYPRLPEGVIDNTHLSPYGAFRVADLAIREIKEKVPQLSSWIKE